MSSTRPFDPTTLLPLPLATALEPAPRGLTAPPAALFESLCTVNFNPGVRSGCFPESLEGALLVAAGGGPLPAFEMSPSARRGCFLAEEFGGRPPSPPPPPADFPFAAEGGAFSE